MLPKPEIDAAAARLVAAEKARVQTGLLSLLHPAMTMDDAYAVQAAYVAQRHAEGRRTIVDTISDNAANAGIVTGGRAMRPDSFDPRWAGAIVMRNAEVEETGLGAGVLNQPARGVAWLANRLSQYGQRIEAGQIVLSGSFIRPIEARHGDIILADFGPLGTVGCFFA
jgi:2-oxo-hept-3-ene-1,7-dioate hydratase